MPEEVKKSGLKIKITQILLTACTAIFYGLFIFSDTIHINIYHGLPLFTLWGLYIPAVVLTGFRAKQLGRSVGGWAVGSFFGGLIPSIVLIFLKKNQKVLLEEKSREKIKESKERKVEKAILAFAKQNKGFVSVSNAALEADITMEEARKLLDELVKNGFAQMEVKPSGTLMYTFQDFLEDD